MPLSNVAYAVDLEKNVPEKNQARYYRLALWRNLFGEVSLMREYGRLDKKAGISGLISSMMSIRRKRLLTVC